MRNIFLFSVVLLSISGCSMVGTAVDVITLPVDLLTMDSSQTAATTHALTAE